MDWCLLGRCRDIGCPGDGDGGSWWGWRSVTMVLFLKHKHVSADTLKEDDSADHKDKPVLLAALGISQRNVSYILI